MPFATHDWEWKPYHPEKWRFGDGLWLFYPHYRLSLKIRNWWALQLCLQLRHSWRHKKENHGNISHDSVAPLMVNLEWFTIAYKLFWIVAQCTPTKHLPRLHIYIYIFLSVVLQSVIEWIKVDPELIGLLKIKS